MIETRYFSDEAIAELELLARYSLSSLHEGLKVHHDAPEEFIAAARRMFDKGMVTDPDGGFLTNYGVEVVEHLQHLLMALGPSKGEISSA